MKAEPHDSLTPASTLPCQAGLSQGRAGTVPSDVGELFLAELQARRERLRQWIRLLSVEAAARAVRTPAAARVTGAKGRHPPSTLGRNRSTPPSGVS